ncbi:aminotransferase-like domain-containing protein [Sphingosinicella rhizophila]|uniref:PLP-dependent aminotransferase family protein n=1 Tax=Sphingosinicella rhizophila TaxID=3050082 RepID=A0ABU3QAH1_9SPHN|nr:PLP-dependent aminotransferase family protein [Sphingosinicella sp. GR2756]MDT9600327.1 PLP-dependent aminotransferase family protein [Sphingosinicella sp. GR2756]
MNDKCFARRAASLSTSFPAPHFPSELAPGTIPFDSGFAAPQLLPDLASFAVDALTRHREETLQYSATQGQPELRGWIAGLMNEDGCALTAENILVVNGAKHGLELVCRLLLDEGDAIVVTAPTYFTAIPIFRSFGVEFIEIAQDGDGILVEELERVLVSRRAEGLKTPKLIYNVADFHNPTGATMSAQRRRDLIALAETDGIFVVEDTPYRRVRFEGETIPSLKALDASGGVFHVGTFSKLVAPGLRIGWVAAEASLIARLIQLKSDGGSSPLMQRIIYEFGSSPAFPAHIQRVQDEYRRRRDRMVAAVRRNLPGVRLSVPEGGYYVWIELPPQMDGDAFAAQAAAAGVNLIAGSKFFASAGGAFPRNMISPKNHVRLSYSYATPEQIDEGVSRLARIYEPVAA